MDGCSSEELAGSWSSSSWDVTAHRSPGTRQPMVHGYTCSDRQSKELGSWWCLQSAFPSHLHPCYCVYTVVKHGDAAAALQSQNPGRPGRRISSSSPPLPVRLSASLGYTRPCLKNTLMIKYLI